MKLSRSQHLINALMACIQAEEGKRITGQRLAEIVQVTPMTISKWINGKTKLEQIEWLLRILEFLPEERWLREVQGALNKGSTKGSGSRKPSMVKKK